MKSDPKKDIFKEREKYRQRAFLMILEIGAIIALPAFVAVFLGNYLDNNNQAERFYSSVLLFIAFVFSWVIIIRKYIRFDKKVKATDKEIKELKEKENVDNPNRRG